MAEIHHRVPEVEIRDCQVEALAAIDANEREGNGSSLVVMAPGLGKTTVMAAYARWRLLENPDARFLFLNDNNDILNQARERFVTIIGGEYGHGLFSGDGRDYDELAVLFGSFQVMRDWHPAFLRDEFHYGIVDESHHSSARTYKPTLDYFNFAHLLGITATPDRMDVLDIRDIYGPERYSLPLERAIADRLLASVDYHVITDEIRETGILQDSAGYVFNYKDLDRSIFVPRRDDEIARIIKQHSENLPRVKRLIFCRSIEQVERFVDYFENGVSYHSELSRSERRQRLADFREDKYDTIFTVDMFNEGIDIPDATQVVFLRQTGSKRIYLQQLGRGLRRTKDKTRVQVLDFVDNCERLLLVDRVWREAAALAGAEPAGAADVIEIDVSRIYFNDSVKRILPMLRKISANVYNPEQEVPLGSVRLSTLSRECGITPSALRAVLFELDIEPSIFPRYQGKDIPYIEREDAERVKSWIASRVTR